MLRVFIEPTICARLRCVLKIRTKTHATQPLSFTCTVFTELLSKQSNALSPRPFEHCARARVAATSNASTPGCIHGVGNIEGQYRRLEAEAIQTVKVQRENSPGQYRRLEAETGTDRRQCSAPSSNQHYVLGFAASLR